MAPKMLNTPLGAWRSRSGNSGVYRLWHRSFGSRPLLETGLFFRGPQKIPGKEFPVPGFGKNPGVFFHVLNSADIIVDIYPTAPHGDDSLDLGVVGLVIPALKILPGPGKPVLDGTMNTA